MHTELAILRAMLRLQRRRVVPDVETLLDRVGGTEAELRVALRALEGGGYVERRAHGQATLTMAGLALAVAQIPAIAARSKRPRAKKSTSNKGRAA